MIPKPLIIDSLVYHDWTAQEELLEYMPAAWQQYVGRSNSIRPGVGARRIPLELPYRNPDGDVIEGSTASGYPTSRGVTVVNAARLARGLDAAVLSFGSGLFMSADNNPQLTLVVCRAMNEWTLAKWAGSDDSHLYVSLIAANQTPADAAADIRRLGKSSRVVQILMTGNGLGKPFGHQLYWPIYEAAVELDLAIAIHAGGDAIADTITLPTATAAPATFSEYRALSAQALMTHAITMIGQGVFETYPTLRVLLVGGGMDWVPATLWRADLEFRAWGTSAPWVKRKPSEYFLEHFWYGTYQIDLCPQSSLAKVLTAYPRLRNRICYASGYPLIDSLTPERADELLPSIPSQQLFRDNAIALYGDRLRSLIVV